MATFENGRYPNRSRGNHAAIVVSVIGSGIWVVDQWTAENRPNIGLRLIKVPPRWKQRNADGSLARPSDNALASHVIEKCTTR
ncbi:BPSL0067 family protein [Massilia sp. TS11]|nr:BPSL0067 family protein [Massilia sp. TS11]